MLLRTILLVAGAAVSPGCFATDAPVDPASTGAQSVDASIWVSDQVTVERVASLQSAGFRAIIDLRPDGEAADQPDSSTIAAAAARAGLQFAHVPVPRENIPAEAVDALARALETSGRPVLLYCGSGRRAARTWALAEASRTGGMGAAAIAQRLIDVHQPSDDLREQIEQRVAARRPPQ